MYSLLFLPVVGIEPPTSWSTFQPNALSTVLCVLAEVANISLSLLLLLVVVVVYKLPILFVN